MGKLNNDHSFRTYTGQHLPFFLINLYQFRSTTDTPVAVETDKGEVDPASASGGAKRTLFFEQEQDSGNKKPRNEGTVGSEKPPALPLEKGPEEKIEAETEKGESKDIIETTPHKEKGPNEVDDTTSK
jgi:hypothetical protein